MLIIQHRINTIRELEMVPARHGVEVDVRGHRGELYLGHDPIRNPLHHDRLEDYLNRFDHALVVFNVKEAGYERQIIDLSSTMRVDRYFLLDVSPPFLYEATRSLRFRKVAVRFSEIEPIEAVDAHVTGGEALCDWVWIDTFTRLPLDVPTVQRLKPFQTCLVCPERWGRPGDIPACLATMATLQFKLDAVMTAGPYASQWEAASC